jgi:hypothetical protein
MNTIAKITPEVTPAGVYANKAYAGGHPHPWRGATEPDWELLPEHLRESVRMYIDEKLHPGAFLAAVGANNLFQAVRYADEENRARLADIVSFFWRYAPGFSVGSQENVDA